MELHDEITARVSKVNADLAAKSDGARVAFVSIEPDPDFENEWLFLLTWQLPDDDEVDGWPLEVLDRYCDIASDELRDLGSTECLFRTAQELTDGAPSGAALQVAKVG